MSQNGSEQTQQYLKILEQSREYPKLIQALSKVLPEFWGKIRADFLEKLTEELCSDRYGFRKTVSNQPFENEIWAERLQKDGKELCLCYETNFFIRTGEQNKWWTYISQAAFEGSREDLSSYCSQKEREAFNLKMFADSNDKLVEWFYDRERFPMAIQCIAESAYRFFCDNN